MERKFEEGFVKGDSAVESGRKNSAIKIKEVVTEIEWALVEYGFYNLKVFGNFIILELSDGKKFRLTVEEAGVKCN